MEQQIILASTSPFRKAILEKLAIPFICRSPDINETALNNENAEQLVQRLATEKAKAVAKEFNNGFIIGSDQVAIIDSQILGKPHTHANAVKQLQLSSGKTVRFLNGLCLLNAATGEHKTVLEPFNVHFKQLTQQQISNYLHLEKPYKCAGSFKSEAAGIALFERLEGNDPNSLIGLPLIRLIELFKYFKVDVLELAIKTKE